MPDLSSSYLTGAIGHRKALLSGSRGDNQHFQNPPPIFTIHWMPKTTPKKGPCGIGALLGANPPAGPAARQKYP